MISNSVDKDLPMLKVEEKYGEDNNPLSSKVYEFLMDVRIRTMPINTRPATNMMK